MKKPRFKRGFFFAGVGAASALDAQLSMCG